MSRLPCTQGHPARTGSWLGTSAISMGGRWRSLAQCSLMVLAGLSGPVAHAQTSADSAYDRGPAFSGEQWTNTAAYYASPPSGVPSTQYETSQVDQSVDQRIRLVPRGEQELEVIQHRSQLINTSDRVRRIHIADPSVLEVIQFSEQEFSLIGVALGTTDLTFWFEDSDDPLLYVANVIRDPSLVDQRRLDYGKIERKLALLYPNSKVYLIPMSRKIIVRGQAKDAEEAARIMQIVRGEALTQEGNLFAVDPSNGNVPVEPAGGPGRVGAGHGGAHGGLLGGDLLSSLIVNELQVPGEFQVMLRVRIAELNRSQLRRCGIDWSVIFHKTRHVAGQKFTSGAPVLTGLFENGEIAVLLGALASNGSAKILADSVVVTMSGHSASFLSGGEFAVPNTIGHNGVLVGTTTFRGFGTSIIATPTVLDNDLIRLQIIPELSAINNANSVGGVPGVDVRRVQTQVELREGQTIVLGGLFSRRQRAKVTRVPLLGKIPLIGTHLFHARQTTEEETEMLIVVTPEIVRPMDAEEVPPLPGFYVTHPDDFDLYKHNRTEGNPDLGHYRLQPYGNGYGYGEHVGFGLHNPNDYQMSYQQMGVMGQEIDSPQMEPNTQMEPNSQIVPSTQMQPGVQFDQSAPPSFRQPQPVMESGSRQSIPISPSPAPPPPVLGATDRLPSLIQQTSAEQIETKPSKRIRFGRWR